MSTIKCYAEPKKLRPKFGVYHAFYDALVPSLALPLGFWSSLCKHDFVPNNDSSCASACSFPFWHSPIASPNEYWPSQAKSLDYLNLSLDGCHLSLASLGSLPVLMDVLQLHDCFLIFQIFVSRLQVIYDPLSSLQIDGQGVNLRLLLLNGLSQLWAWRAQILINQY